MANDSFSDRRREREKEEEEAKKALKELENDDSLSTGPTKNAVSTASDQFLELIHQADLSIDHVNNLYQMFAVGVERLPPLEREKLLDKTISNLQTVPKPTPTSRFRFNTLQARYLSFKEKWNRLMKDLESGKIKRTTGPKR